MILRKICQNTISSAEIREEEKETFMNVIGERQLEAKNLSKNKRK